VLAGAALGFTRRYPSISLTVLTGNDNVNMQRAVSIWRSISMIAFIAINPPFSDG
jgi:hypothetical protein